MPTPTVQPTESADTTVDTPPEVVYALVSDLPRMGEWSPENTGGRWTGRLREPVVGARFAGTNSAPGRWWPSTTVVTDARPGRRFAFETRIGPVVAAEWAYDFVPVGDGCRVVESWTDRRGPVMRTVGRIVTGVPDRRAHTRSMIASTLAALKRTAESTTA